MSFILDALRKSETERQRDAAPTLTRAALAPPRRGTPPWSWLITAVLAVALVALGGTVWLGRQDAGLTPSSVGTPAQPVTPTQERMAEPEVTRAAPPPVAPAPASTQDSAQADAIDAPPRPLSELMASNPALGEYELAFVAFDSADPAQSSAWINGRRLYPGENIGNGVTLAEVTPNSVILAYQGRRYLLRL